MIFLLIDNITDAKRLIDLAFGIDDTPVKMSGKPLSIGLEDRFKCISAKSECLEKVDILVQRLAKLGIVGVFIKKVEVFLSKSKFDSWPKNMI